MTKFAAALALVLGLGFATAPAYADCAGDITTVKVAWDKVADKAKKDAAMPHYQTAEKALKDKNEKACVEALDKARTAMK